MDESIGSRKIAKSQRALAQGTTTREFVSSDLHNLFFQINWLAP
jgi:hypothetical protein